MKLAANAHIAAPITEVWRVLTDLTEIEAAAARNQIGMTQRFAGVAPGAGLSWDVNAGLRGRMVTASVWVTQMTEPTLIKIEGQTGSQRTAGDLSMRVELALRAVDPDWTLMTGEARIGANTVKGKVLLQPLRLAKGKLRRSVQGRFDAMALGIEARARRLTPIS
ncbi:MAG: hypothetical protein ACPG7W_07830 [Paracoccaceae bacterium]